MSKQLVSLVAQPRLLFLLGGLLLPVSLPAAAALAVQARDCAVVTDSSLQWNGWMKGAVCDFTNAVARKTGVVPRVYIEPFGPKAGVPVVYLGRTAAAKAAGLSEDGMRRLSFRIKAEPGRVFVFSPTATGVSYGIGEILRRDFDYWFLTASGDDPCVPNAKIAIPVGDRRGEPEIYFRDVYTGMANGHRYPTTKVRWDDYLRRLRLASENSYDLDPSEHVSYTPGDDCHTYFKYCSPEKYFKEHPEYFSMGPDGKRQARPRGELCLTNPDVKRIVYESLKGFVEKDRKARPKDAPCIYDFSQEDNCDYLCHCPACKAVIAKYNRVSGGHAEGGDAGLQLEFVNDIARRIAKEHPDVVLRTFAYVSTEMPPKEGTIVPAKNVLVWLCDMYGQSDHMLPLSHPFNAPRLDVFGGWRKIAPRLELWDYSLFDARFPEVSVDAIVSDAKYFRTLGLGRILNDIHYKNQAFYELDLFAMGECDWCSKQDPDALVRRWCAVYGRGADDMVAAIAFLRKLILENPPKDYVAWHTRVLPWRTVENWAEFVKLVTKAYEKESDPLPRSRIAKVLASAWCEIARLCRSTYGLEGRLADAQARYRRFAIEDSAYAMMEPSDRSAFARNFDARVAFENLRFKDLPPGCRDVPANDLKCVDYRRMESEVTMKAVEDPDSETGHASVFLLGKGQGLAKDGVYAGGVYDRTSGASTALPLKVTPDILDERYHWVRLGEAEIGMNSIYWIMNWYLSFYVNEFFVFCDGTPLNLNRYEFWVSVKFQGPGYVKGSTKPNGIFYDRLVLKRLRK